MKRFSWLSFIGVTLLHIYITDALYVADMHSSGVDPEPRSAWLVPGTWIFQPVVMLLWVMRADLGGALSAIALTWSVCIGVFVGLLVPRIFTWKRRNRLTRRCS